VTTAKINVENTTRNFRNSIEKAIIINTQKPEFEKIDIFWGRLAQSVGVLGPLSRLLGPISGMVGGGVWSE